MDYFKVCCKKCKIYRDKEKIVYVYENVVQQGFILQYNSYSNFSKLEGFANVSLNAFDSYLH